MPWSLSALRVIRAFVLLYLMHPYALRAFVPLRCALRAFVPLRMTSLTHVPYLAALGALFGCLTISLGWICISAETFLFLRTFY